MKHILRYSVVGLFLLLGLAIQRTIPKVHAHSVTDSCSGIQTTFTANVPASVSEGQTFSVSGITSRPVTSYGVTVTSSTLYLTASGASPASYSQANTSTDPSPTTGASTYTAYFPDWSLTANGAAGSQVTVKLSKITAVVDGIGPITCDFTATLATINITAATSPSGGGSSGGGSSTTPNKPSTTPSPNTPAAPTTPEAITEESEPLAAELSSQIVPLTVHVVNNKGQSIEGAEVVLDEQLTAQTGADGKVSFADIRIGEHRLRVTYAGKTTEQTIQVAAGSSTEITTITVPTKPRLWLYILVGALTLAVVFIVIFLIIKKVRRPKIPQTFL